MDSNNRESSVYSVSVTTSYVNPTASITVLALVVTLLLTTVDSLPLLSTTFTLILFGVYGDQVKLIHATYATTTEIGTAAHWFGDEFFWSGSSSYNKHHVNHSIYD